MINVGCSLRYSVLSSLTYLHLWLQFMVISSCTDWCGIGLPVHLSQCLLSLLTNLEVLIPVLIFPGKLTFRSIRILVSPESHARELIGGVAIAITLLFLWFYHFFSILFIFIRLILLGSPDFSHTLFPKRFVRVQFILRLVENHVPVSVFSSLVRWLLAFSW